MVQFRTKKIFCFLIFISLAMAAYAGPWAQDKDAWLDIFTLRYYDSTRFWNSSGNLSNVPIYTKYELDNYLEYGLTERLTLGAYLSALQSYTAAEGIHRGDNDNEIFGRYVLWQENGKILSFEAFFDLLGSAVQFNVPPSNSHYNTGEALLFGTSGELSKKQNSYWFFDTSAGLIQRYSSGSQLQVNLEGGLKFYQNKLWLFLQEYNTLSLNKLKSPQGVNYNLFTISPSIVYWLAKGFGLQLGIAQDFYGQNVGKGTTKFVAGWFRF
jgi:hypothetical protein